MTALAILAIAILLYTFFFEPYWIEVTRHSIPAKKICSSKPLKLMHLTDLHIRSFGRREKSVLKLIESEKPDFIAVTGDYVTNRPRIEATLELLSRLEAPLGVFLVPGNWEYWRPSAINDRVHELKNLRVVLNSNAEVSPGLWIIGVDDARAGKPDEQKAFAGVPEDVFRLTLFHSPISFDQISKPFDLALAGHTHAGQFRIPFVGALYIPPGSGSYVKGFYRHKTQDKSLFVGRGVGTSGIDGRFACRPEITIFTLES